MTDQPTITAAAAIRRTVGAHTPGPHPADERTVRAATAIQAKVRTHADGGDTGGRKHGPGDGCTGRCANRALRNFVDRAELRDAALAHAVAQGWVEQRDGRWHPGPHSAVAPHWSQQPWAHCAYSAEDLAVAVQCTLDLTPSEAAQLVGRAVVRTALSRLRGYTGAHGAMNDDEVHAAVRRSSPGVDSFTVTNEARRTAHERQKGTSR